MECRACQSERTEGHCSSGTCDWVRCLACGAVSQKNGDQYYIPKGKGRSRNG